MPIQVINPDVYHIENRDDLDTVDFCGEIHQSLKPMWWTWWKNQLLKYMGYKRSLVDPLFAAVERWEYVDPELPEGEFVERVLQQREKALPFIHLMLAEMTGVQVDQMPRRELEQAELAGLKMLQDLRKILDMYRSGGLYLHNYSEGIHFDPVTLRVVGEMPHEKYEREHTTKCKEKIELK